MTRLLISVPPGTEQRSPPRKRWEPENETASSPGGGDTTSTEHVLRLVFDAGTRYLLKEAEDIGQVQDFGFAFEQRRVGDLRLAELRGHLGDVGAVDVGFLRGKL